MIVHIESIKKCSECGNITGYEGDQPEIKQIMKIYGTTKETRVDFSEEENAYFKDQKLNNKLRFRRNRLMAKYFRENVKSNLRCITKKEYLNLFEESANCHGDFEITNCLHYRDDSIRQAGILVPKKDIYLPPMCGADRIIMYVPKGITVYSIIGFGHNQVFDSDTKTAYSFSLLLFRWVKFKEIKEK
jgi:hypothetical protein